MLECWDPITPLLHDSSPPAERYPSKLRGRSSSKGSSCFLFAIVCFLFAGCSESTGPKVLDKAPVRERIEVSGLITEDAVAIAKCHRGGLVYIRVISWFTSFLWTVMRGGLPLSPSPCLSLPVLRSSPRFHARWCCGARAHLGFRPHLGGYGAVLHSGQSFD